MQRKVRITLHLLTVKTYMKKRDLQFDLQLTEINNRKEAEIAGRGMEKRGQLQETCTTERTVTRDESPR